MSTRVYKYELPVIDEPSILMPSGAEILAVQVQGDRPYVWARVDPDDALQRRFFRIAGTGHALDEDVGKHIGSFQLHGGALVFHVFEKL